MAERKKKTIHDFSWRFGVKLVAMIAALGGTAAYASARYTIGLDTQEHRCLDEWIYVIDTWKRPTADDVQRFDYVAVALTAEQTPANAKWRPGHVMVKRAVATDPGDQVEITREGINFSHGEEIWAHGTALEAAEMIGSTPEAFEREFQLAEGELFLMGDKVNSYDGRYYGPVREEQIVGTVLWAW